MDTGILINIPPVVGVALEVIGGQWGVGEDRKKKLQAAGYDYFKIQSCVNELLEIFSRYEVE